jgi:hypothetical protein
MSGTINEMKNFFLMWFLLRDIDTIQRVTACLTIDQTLKGSLMYLDKEVFIHLFAVKRHFWSTTVGKEMFFDEDQERKNDTRPLLEAILEEAPKVSAKDKIKYAKAAQLFRMLNEEKYIELAEIKGDTRARITPKGETFCAPTEMFQEFLKRFKVLNKFVALIITSGAIIVLRDYIELGFEGMKNLLNNR